MNELFNAVLTKLNAPASIKNELWNIGHPISFPAKNIISEIGEINDYAYFLINGSVKQYMYNKYNEECVVNFWQRPDFFACSMPSFFFDKKAFVCSQTITTVEAIQFQKSDFFNLASKNTDFYKLISTILLGVYLKREQREIRLTNHSGEERFLHFLEEYPGLVDHVSMKNLASYLQIHPGSLSRIKKNLKNGSK